MRVRVSISKLRIITRRTTGIMPTRKCELLAKRKMQDDRDLRHTGAIQGALKNVL